MKVVLVTSTLGALADIRRSGDDGTRKHSPHRVLSRGTACGPTDQPDCRKNSHQHFSRYAGYDLQLSGETGDFRGYSVRREDRPCLSSTQRRSCISSGRGDHRTGRPWLVARPIRLASKLTHRHLHRQQYVRPGWCRAAFTPATRYLQGNACPRASPVISVQPRVAALDALEGNSRLHPPSDG